MTRINPDNQLMNSIIAGEYAANETDLNIKNDLKKAAKSKGVNKKAATDSVKDPTIKQFLSSYSNSEKAKTNLMQHSHSQVLEHQNPDALSKELAQFFNPSDKSTDEVRLSEESIDTDIDQSTFITQSSFMGDHSNKNSKLLKQKIQQLLSNEELIDDDNDLFTEKRHVSKSKESQSNMAKNQPSLLHKKDVQTFAQLMSNYVVGGKTPTAKKEIDRHKKTLLAKGVSTQEVSYMSSKVGQLMQQHVVYDLKKKLIKLHMSAPFSKHELVSNKFDFNSASTQYESMYKNGQFNQDIYSIIDNLKDQSQKELSNFIYEESVNQLSQFSVGEKTIEEYSKSLEQLLKMGASAGIIIQKDELDSKILSSIDHLGLAAFSMNSNTDSNQQQQQQHQPILTPEEALDDKLRYLYMIKALEPSLRHRIKVGLKMKKCKNGMIKLGLYTEEKENDLKKQGELLAAQQFKEKLGFAFREEATLERLMGFTIHSFKKRNDSF